MEIGANKNLFWKLMDNIQFLSKFGSIMVRVVNGDKNAVRDVDAVADAPIRLFCGNGVKIEIETRQSLTRCYTEVFQFTTFSHSHANFKS